MDASLRVVLATATACAPVRADADAAGYDLAAAEEARIPPRGRGLVSTGLRLGLPRGVYARLAPRSGNAVNGLDVQAGVVDRGYTGIVYVLLANATDHEIEVAPGRRIAQLILERHETPAVEVVATLAPTARGESGFGSSGD